MKNLSSVTRINRIWIAGAALSLSAVWLISSKTALWSNLYKEAWAAIACTFVVGSLLYRSKPNSLQISLASLLCAVLVMLPAIQYAFGLVLWIGDALVQSSYIAGLFLAVTATQQLDMRSKYLLLTAVAFSLLVAATGSVLLQWFQLSGFTLDWLREERNITRPSANLSQPNHLGTLLVLGLISAQFLSKQKRISRALLFSTTTLLSLGIALTASRTALLAVVALALWQEYLWRRGSTTKDTYWRSTFTLLILAHIFVFLMWKYFPFGAMLDPNLNHEPFRTDSSGRLEAWMMFIHRIVESPWVGYGMGQVSIAHLIGDTHVRSFGGLFQSSHNLVLDVFLWGGIPLGICVLLAAVYVIGKTIKVTNEERYFASAASLAILNHAMLEFPLFYSYFLLYFGLFIGANTDIFAVRYSRVPGPSRSFVALSAVLTLSIIGKLTLDFKNTSDLVSRADITQPLNLSYINADLGINQHWLLLVNYSLESFQFSEDAVDLAEIEAVYLRFPTVNVGLNYAIQLQRRGESAAVQQSLKRTCLVQSPTNCEYLRLKWEKLPQLHPGIANEPWPVTSVRFDLTPLNLLVN